MIPFAYAKKFQLLMEFTIPYQKSQCGYAEYKYNNLGNFQFWIYGGYASGG